MHTLKVEWKAYPMDRCGIKTCQRGEVQLTSTYRLVNLHDVLERTRQKVWSEYPDLQSTPIQLIDFRFIEQEAA